MSNPYASFIVVAVIAFSAPVIRAVAPRLLVPAIVLELVGGILVGPSVLGWASVTEPVEVFSQIGLVALLFLAGREIQIGMLVGPVLRRAAVGFVISLALGLPIGLGLEAAGVLDAPLLVAIILASTSLSVIIVPLRDAGQTDTQFGQQVIAAAAIAEFGAVLLLAFFFSGDQEGFATELVHLIAFALAALILAAAAGRAGRLRWLNDLFDRLESTSAQIKIRGDIALLAIVIALAVELGLEAILAAFTVGVIRGIGEPSERAREKIEGVTLGVFVPFFFIASGLELDVGELFESAGDLLEVPLFAGALLVVRGLPALLVYRRAMTDRLRYAAGLLQATSLSFIIVATEIGRELDAITTETSTALVAAGLLSVIIFPASALGLLAPGARRELAAEPAEVT